MQNRIRNRNLASIVHLGEEFNKRFIVYFYKFIDGRPTYTARPKSSEAYKSIIEYRKWNEYSRTS